jgi:iron(III) transport system ATP-binding protein
MYLEVQQVSIRYPRSPAPAVDAVSLRLQAGELGVLLGPSGSGKTSLLRAVAGLEAAQSGRILLDGRLLEGDGVRVAAEARRIGMVFQDFALFPHLDVAANVGFGLRGVARAERARIVDDMLALVGLPEVRGKFPHQLSGGQQQRIALARALAPRPGLLLLDEPFSSLDVELRERLAHDVRDILKRSGATALMVTHDQMEAFAVGDVVGVMRQGRLEQWDTPYALYHRPATRFTADFVGHGVLLQGRLLDTGTAGEIEVETAAGRLRSGSGSRTGGGIEDEAESGIGVDSRHPGMPGADGQPAQKTKAAGTTPAALETIPETTIATASTGSGGSPGIVEVLLRADDVMHDDASPFKAKVLRKSFRGAEFLYTLELENGQQLLSLVPSHHDHAIGERIGIRLDVTHLVTFPAERSAHDAIAR